MMPERVQLAIENLFGFLRGRVSFDPLILLPAVILFLAWPMFQVYLDNRAEAFMCAFVLAMSVRYGLRFEFVVRNLRRSVPMRAVALLVLLAGPGILALLIWRGEPIWCQRFLTGYFLVLAALHALDLITGEHRMIKSSWPSLVLPRAITRMSQVMAIYYLCMVLLNETLISQVDPVVWLGYFGLLPLMSRVIVNRLVESVKTGFQGAA